MQNADEQNTEGEFDTIRYFLRSRCKKRAHHEEPQAPLSVKRRKLNSCSNAKNQEEVVETCSIHLLPADILSQILAHFSYQELSSNLRSVCKKFKDVAEDLLNSNFTILGKRVTNLLNFTKTFLHMAEGDIEVKCYCRLVNMLEIVEFQHSVIRATIWRYVFNQRYKMFKMCMYGGKILDTYNNFLRKFTEDPGQLTAGVIGRDYMAVFHFQAMPAEVNTIVRLTKTFCLHFERINEELVNTDLMVSGCKILDFFDSAVYAKKDVVYEKVNDDVFSGRYSYFFKNTWFVAMNVNSERQMTWCQKQRMMHMRIRRILLAHTEMLMQQNQYDREALMRRSDNFLTFLLRKPNSNVYTGYGDIQDKFFFYGVMNDEAYVQKFHPTEVNLDEPEFDDEASEDRPPLTDKDYEKKPFLGMHVDVKVRCPLSRAPYTFLEKNFPLDLSDWSRTRQPRKKKPYKKFSMKMSIECMGASYTRLPTMYEYQYKQT